MKKRVPQRFSKATGVVALLLMTTGVTAQGRAQQLPPPPPMPMPAQAPAIPPAEAPPIVLPVAAAPAPVGAPGEATDHDGVVGLWGVEARHIETFKRTRGEDADCGDPCTVDMNALSLRKWINPRYAYTAGLALGAGGGSRRATADETQTFDTYFGFGPTLGASFLLANWKHLAVSFAPQLDAIYFLPSSKGTKSLLIDLRGLIEGEVHLGMIGLPSASVGLSTGLVASFLSASKDEKAFVAGAVASRWSLGLTGPTSLWNLVTNATLRYYF